MTDPNYTAICLVVDRSGSMRSVRSDAEGAINAFLDDQRKAEGKRTVRLVTFDQDYDLICPSTDVRLIQPFALRPRGTTALLDAMGRGITEFGEELAALPEEQRPGTVIFAIMTDGYENSSKDWTLAQVRAAVEHQRAEFAWNVLYLGANQDAIQEGAKFGVDAGSSLTYSASGAGLRGTRSALDSYVAVAASGVFATFSDEDRERAMGSEEE